MTYGYDTSGLMYGCDGVYFNINALSQYEEEAKEYERQQATYERDKLKLKLTKHLSKYSTHEKILFHSSRFLLKEHQQKLIKRYLTIETLPIAYGEVVKQRDALQILIGEFFIKIVGSGLDYFDQTSLDQLLAKVSENIEREPAYFRVNELRQFIGKVIETKSKKERLNLPLNKEGTRQLLSACRLCLLLNDYVNKSDTYQIEVCERTKQSFAYEMLKPIEEGMTLPNGKKYISRWKARHLHTLEFYAYAGIGKKLKKLKAINRNTDVYKYINAIVEICL